MTIYKTIKAAASARFPRTASLVPIWNTFCCAWMKLHDESWLNYQRAKGEENFQAYMADLTDMQEHVLPYLQSFCGLEEKAPERVEGKVQLLADGEKRLPERAVSDKAALKQDSLLENEKTMGKKERKSIHERLKTIRHTLYECPFF